MRSGPALLGALSALAVVGATTAFTLGTPSPASAATACEVGYTVNDWGSGFTANLTLKNLGTAPLSGWQISYAYAGNQQLQQGWNATWAQTGKTVTVTPAGWNGTVAPGSSITAGANFGYSGTNTAPAVDQRQRRAVRRHATPDDDPAADDRHHHPATGRGRARAARRRQPAGRLRGHAGHPARGEPLRRRVRLRAGQRHLRRPDGRRLRGRHQELARERRARAVQRGLLARPAERRARLQPARPTAPRSSPMWTCCTRTVSWRSSISTGPRASTPGTPRRAPTSTRRARSR